MNDQEPLDILSPQNAGHSPLPPPPAASPKLVEQSAVVPSNPDPSAPMPGGRRLGLPPITAVVLGLLSFVVGLGLFFSSKTGAPADRSEVLADSKIETPADGPGPLFSSKTGAPENWSEVISALQGGAPADRNGPATKNTVESKKTSADPKPEAKAQPKPVPGPWPPETLAFAGKKAGEEWSENGLSMNFCWCPAGTFVMGSPKDEKEREFNRTSEDQLEATLTKGFWLGKYELTQGQWESVMGTDLLQQADGAWVQIHWENKNEGYYDTWWDMNRLKLRAQRRARRPEEQNYGEGPSYPMYFVNHLEATDFCLKLTARERRAGRLPPGWEYRLPTEAQWEYACRAGTKTATAFGDRLSSRQADFDGSLPYNGAAQGPKLDRMQPVGSYQSNGWGLCDMHGNAWEWCRDWDGQRPGGRIPRSSLGT
jgi:sulfatase modifying factor 1